MSVRLQRWFNEARGSLRDFHDAFLHGAIEWRADVHVFQVELGADEFRPGSLEFRAGLGELRVGDVALGLQLLLALPGGLVLADAGPRLLEAGRTVTKVELHERLARRGGFAAGDPEGGDPAARLGLDLHGARGRGAAVHADGAGHRLGLLHPGLDSRGACCGRGRPAGSRLPRRLATQESGGQPERDDDREANGDDPGAAGETVEQAHAKSFDYRGNDTPPPRPNT